MKSLTYSAAPSHAFRSVRKKRRFLRQVQDTESIEVQGQPLPTGRKAEPPGLSRLPELAEVSGQGQARPRGRLVERVDLKGKID
jgi:hypothetical protein